jgi:hypothetical protein
MLPGLRAWTVAASMTETLLPAGSPPSRVAVTMMFSGAALAMDGEQTRIIPQRKKRASEKIVIKQRAGVERPGT